MIIAADRELRPVPLQLGHADATAAHDPFLEGEEAHTPSERLALRRCESGVDQTGWLVRVVPNRYPAVIQADECPVRPAEVSAREQRPPQKMPLHGFHDVVIECPDHRTQLTQLSVEEIARVLLAWQQRVVQLQQDGRFPQVRIFRNQGATAGASLPHCHSQIVATALTDDTARQPLWTGRCLDGTGENPIYTAWYEEELRTAERVLRSTPQLLVVCPFASRFAWQTRICPGPDMPARFERLSVTQLSRVAAHLRLLCLALEQLSPNVGCNLSLILPPGDEPTAFPWMLDVLPRPGRIAGFELMTGLNIVTVSPETAARQFRDTIDWTDTAAAASQRITPVGYEWRSE